MTTNYYVTTSELGVERTADMEVQWALPHEGASEETTGDHLVLRTPNRLLDVLDEAIWVAEAVGEGSEQAPGELSVRAARLVARTPWAPLPAAQFALDCAEHVVGDAGDVELPGGVTLAGAIAEARTFLAEASDEQGERLGRLARYSAARRLRKQGAQIGDLALEMLEADLGQDLDATTDVAWTITTATGDAVLAAIETLRHLAAPRYVAAREEYAEREESTPPLATPTPITTPFGPVMIGAEAQSPYMSSGALAREAAFRAREAAGTQSEAERAWQAARLEKLLAG